MSNYYPPRSRYDERRFDARRDYQPRDNYSKPRHDHRRAPERGPYHHSDDERRRGPPHRSRSLDYDHRHSSHSPRHHHHHSSSRRRSPSPDRHHRPSRRDSDVRPRTRPSRPEARDHSPRRSSNRRHSMSSGKLPQAAAAAFDAAAIEAIRVRKNPGTWTGAKGARVATAAIGAAATDAAVGRDRREDTKMSFVQSTIGGLLASRALHGFRDDKRRRR